MSPVRLPAGMPGRVDLVTGLVLLALALSGCNGDGSEDPGPPAVPTLPPPAPPSPDPVQTPCLSANPGFISRGTVSILGRSDPDASQLSGLDWVLTPDCERVVFRFLTDEAAPASSIGLSRIEFFPRQGIVRVTMPRDVDTTGIADTVMDGTLIDRAFVVRSRSGELSVDLHTGGDPPIEARGLLIGSPARLVVDVRPGPPAEGFGAAPPTVTDSVVVLSPAPGLAEYPLRIRGYARTPTDAVTARVLLGDRAGKERRVVVAPSTDAWGEFAVTISEGPVGDVVLEVEPDPGAGDDGVSMALTVR